MNLWVHNIFDLDHELTLQTEIRSNSIMDERQISHY